MVARPASKMAFAYNSRTYLQERHQIPLDLSPSIAVIETLMATVAT
jgi:hypothetical protein